MTQTAFIFPGQGAQLVGMGQDVANSCPEAMDLFNRANAIVGFDLKTLCFAGQQEQLNGTDVSQPAIFVVSAALLNVMQTTVPQITCQFTAGLSMGEYTALYAAGLMTFEQALTLVCKRGKAMQQAALDSHGGMVSIMGLDDAKIQELCKDAAGEQLLVAANFNCPGQTVISGDIDACQRAVGLAEKYGAIKAIPLAVAGAFHTGLMNSAANDLKTALDLCPIQNPDKIKVIANINAGYYLNADDIRKGLVRQLIEPILWQKCIEKLMADGVTKFYEIGPNRVLTGLMKRINRKADCVNVSNLESLEALKKL